MVITLVRSVKYERRVIFTFFQCFDLEIMIFDDVPGGSFKNFKRAGCKSNIHIWSTALNTKKIYVKIKKTSNLFKQNIYIYIYTRASFNFITCWFINFICCYALKCCCHCLRCSSNVLEFLFSKIIIYFQYSYIPITILLNLFFNLTIIDLTNFEVFVSKSLSLTM